MAIKSYRPYTPSRRYMTGLDSSDITAKASVPALLTKLAEIADKRQLQFQHEKLYEAEAVLCDDELQKKWGEVVEQHTQKTPCFLSSGAGHDAMVMTNITNIGMLLVRCEKGISHNPREQVTDEDVAVALSCLVDMIKKLA